MALRSGYKGFKKLVPGLKLFRPGTLGIDNDVLIPELNKTFFPRSEQAVLGAKNLLPNNAVSGSDNNTTWVVDADKFVTVNTGTGGASANVVIDVIRPITIKKGSYKLSGCPSGGSYGTYYIQLRKADGTQYDIRDTGSGYDLTLSEDTTFTYCAIVLLSGTEANNLVFQPMISLDGGKYAPHAMTNKELTDAVAVKNGLSSVTVIEGATLSANDSFLRKQNNVISAQLRVNGVTANSGANIATIPSGYISSLTGGTVVFMSNASTGEMIPAYITINGYVRARTNLSSVDVNINFTYIAP